MQWAHHGNDCSQVPWHWSCSCGHQWVQDCCLELRYAANLRAWIGRNCETVSRKKSIIQHRMHKVCHQASHPVPCKYALNLYYRSADKTDNSSSYMVYFGRQECVPMCLHSASGNECTPYDLIMCLQAPCWCWYHFCEVSFSLAQDLRTWSNIECSTSAHN